MKKVIKTIKLQGWHSKTLDQKVQVLRKDLKDDESGITSVQYVTMLERNDVSTGSVLATNEEATKAWMDRIREAESSREEFINEQEGRAQNTADYYRSKYDNLKRDLSDLSGYIAEW